MAASALCQKPTKGVVLNSPITESTAISFFWFGDMESHFRSPVNFYVVSTTDRKFHTVSMGRSDHQWNAFISDADMRRLIDGLKALDLRWMDYKSREAFIDGLQRKDLGLLEVTVVSNNATSKANIRIARMCDQLASLDPAIPSPRILWQFQLFRVDNGCLVPGYDNNVIPPE